MKKYSLTKNSIDWCGKKLFQIKAEISFGSVSKGDLGGYIEKEENLSQVSGDAWVSGNAQVSDNAQVYGAARSSSGRTPCASAEAACRKAWSCRGLRGQ